MVEKNITELLKNHDCVIVPGFGGFLARYQPARIDPVRHRFEPPCRLISFNSRLTGNDGLLINHISRTSGLPYKKAEEIVENFSSQLKQQLESNQEIEISGIGKLAFTGGGQLIFSSPVNHDLWEEGFGLDSFIAPRIVKKEKRVRTTQQRTDRKPARVRKGMPAAVKITIATAVPLIIFLLYGIIHPTGIKKLTTNYSGIIQLGSWNNYDNTRASTPVFTMTNINYEDPQGLALINPQFRKNEGIKLTPDDLVNKVPGGYHIIAGTFTSEIAAADFIELYRMKGYTPLITGMNDRGDYRVSVKSFVRKNDALEFLAMFRKEEIPDAWLLKK